MDGFVATRAIETLQYLRRSHMSVNEENLCEILLGPTITSNQDFRRVSTFGTCRTHSREAVLGAITNAISTGLLDVSQTGALSVVPQMIEWQFAGAKRARPQEAAYVPPPALYVPPSRPPPPPLDTTVPVPSALEEFEAAVEREEARAVASVAAASAALRATRAAAAAALASAQQPVAATTLDSSVTAGSASTGHLSRAAGAGVGAGSGARANAGANRSSAASAPADDSLTEEQTQVWRLVVVEGRSVFFTGSAGTGKSFLLRRIISDLKEKYREENRPDAVVVTAPTGIAACNIGGVTLHSFAGIGQGREPADKLCAMVNRSVNAKARWREVRVLVIDEVSMLDAGLFDKLDYIARRVRGRDLPFGGIHLVIAGDFFQLPPVGLTGGAPSAVGDQPTPPIKFAFEAAAWSRSIYAQLTLRRVFRQKDGGFVQMLNEFRVGIVTPDAERAVQAAGATVRAMEAARSLTKPTSIYALNKNVDEVNFRELARCEGTAVDYTAIDSGEEPFISTLRSSCIAPTALSLKVGAQVMLIKNLDAEKGLVNGARGFVSRFVNGVPEVTFSVSAHAKSKNTTGDAAGASTDAVSDDISMVLQPQEWTLELGSRVVATRQQIPLKLAYALSIHKSQGMTIDLLDVSMKGVFEYGQAYVALSRAVSLDRVRVSAFTASLVKAHPVVVAYYKWLEMPSPKGPFVPPQRSVDAANVAGAAWGNSGGGAGGRSGGGGGGFACFRCQQTGHFSRDCPTKK